MRMQGSASSASLSQPKYPISGSMKITHQVIEEVDEQMTITSMRPTEPRATAQSLFAAGPPPASHPVDVPVTSRQTYSRTHSALAYPECPFTFQVNDSDTFISASAPTTTHMQGPNMVYDIDFDTSAQSSKTDDLNNTGTGF